MLLKLIQVVNVLLPVAMSAPTIYDQRQTGTSNVRIDLRDAILIAVAEDFGDYDYTYDYSDLTIKPEESTTSKPATSTAANLNVSSTEATAVLPQNASVIIDNSTLTFVKPEPVDGGHTQMDYQIPVIVLQDTSENVKLLPVKIVEKAHKPAAELRNCSPGFFLDNQNRCKRIRKPLRENVQLRKTPEKLS